MKVDPSDTYQIIILLILLALSAFFSSNETALMSVNKIRLRSLADEGNKRAAMALDILENQTPKLLSAILIGNNIVNISAVFFPGCQAGATVGIIPLGICSDVVSEDTDWITSISQGLILPLMIKTKSHSLP